MKRVSCILTLLVFLGAMQITPVKAQQSLVYAHDNAEFKEAKQFFDLKKYVVAQRKFKKVYNSIDDPNSSVKMDAEYFIALCALELFHKDAEYLFVKFIERHPQSPKVRRSLFYLGQYNYRQKRWSSANKWFKQVDENDLEDQEKPEFQFKYGYTLFKKKDFTEAQKYFHMSKQVESDYQKPAQFYYAHLAYKFSFYEVAYKEFKDLERDSVYAAIVPYYVTQILYLQNKNEELVNYGSKFLKKANTKRGPEIARLVGEGHYKLNNYDSTIVYLEDFKSKVSTMDTMGYFQLGYAYYKTGSFEKALLNFGKCADDETRVGQLSTYYAGDCYLKLGNKDAARRQFRFAYRNQHDFGISENALFSYAKLSFELDIDPYHESIRALENYIFTYPKSTNIDKARKILLDVYLNTKNYDKAIAALEKIKNKGPQYQYAFQKIAYFRGIQEFNQQSVGFQANNQANFKKSIFFFDKSLQFPEDRKIEALAKYWKAEALYRLDLFSAALLQYDDFKKSTGAILLDEYKEVDYQLGYTYMRLKDYGPAIKAFRNYIQKSGKVPTDKLNDAYLRAGDSYLILSNNLKGAQKQNELLHAVNYYQAGIKLGRREVDYGYYQLGQAYKLLNKYELEAEAFENLIFEYPRSRYVDDAKFKAGNVYYERLAKYDIAYKYFKDIVDNHKNNTSLVQQSYNKMANIKREQGSFVEAADFYEKAVTIDPRTEYAKSALTGLRQLSTFDLKDADRYLKFRAGTGLPDESNGAKDTLNYESAKSYYVEANYSSAVSKLSDYTKAFPNGIFITDANYMLGESYFQQKNTKEAVVYFDKVIESPYGEWTEEALYKSANIYMQAKAYQKAIQRFLLLDAKANYDVYRKDAQVGLMLAYNELEDNKNTAKYAELVAQNNLVSNSYKFQAMLLLGNAHFNNNDYDKATLAYQNIVAKTQKVMAAEALYQLAYIDFVKDDLEGSKAKVIQLIKEFSNYGYWSSKGLILLADIFIKQDELVNAKFTLKSILENYEDPEIVGNVHQRLDKIAALEEAAIKPQVEEDVYIDIGDNQNAKDALFDDIDEEEYEEEPLDSVQFNNIFPNDTLNKR